MNNILILMILVLIISVITLIGIFFIRETKRRWWIIEIDEVYDYERSDHTPELYHNRKDAIRRLEQIHSVAFIEYGDRWKDDTDDLANGSVSLFLDGEESCNHYYATLHEVKPS